MKLTIEKYFPNDDRNGEGNVFVRSKIKTRWNAVRIANILKFSVSATINTHSPINSKTYMAWNKIPRSSPIA